jgi:hypothetical protein
VDDYSKRLKQGLTHLGPVRSGFYFCLLALGLIVYSRTGSPRWPLAIMTLIAGFEVFRLVCYVHKRK